MERVKVAIIGSGPAGYTAAIYTSRAQLQPMLFAGPKAGGQLMWTTDIENFPGFKDGVAGPDLMIQMMEQAQRFGTKISYDYVTAVDFSARPFKLWTTVPQGLVPEEVLTTYTPEVKVMWNSTIEEVLGDQFVQKFKVKTPEGIKELEADGVFVAIGHKPVTQLFQNVVQLDDHGYVVTRQSVSKLGVEAAQGALADDGKVAYPSMTSVEGVFAAGDNVDIRYRQAITAAGQGCSAALDAERWLESQDKQ